VTTDSSAAATLAVVQRAYGPPEMLAAESLRLSPLAPGEIRVSTIAAAVNYSDLQIRAGRWPIRRAEPFPYVPGLEVVGSVVEVGPGTIEWRVGDVVVSMMQGMGGVRAERPGGYAQLVTLPAAAAARVPPGVDPIVAATVGLAGITGYAGLHRLGSLRDAAVVITGATGGVGSTAVRIAAALGARPIAVVSAPGAGRELMAAGAARVVTAAELAELPAGSVDAVLDSVAGPLFGASITLLRPGGRYCLVGAAAGATVTWDAFSLLEGIVLTGWSSETLDGKTLRQLWDPLMALVADSRLAVAQPTMLALTEAARAHELLESRAVTGRLLLTPI
jgi:NADPH2:quinone reductase